MSQTQPTSNDEQQTDLPVLIVRHPADLYNMSFSPPIDRQHLLVINGQEADDVTYKRVITAKPKPVGKARCNQPKAFSILR